MPVCKREGHETPLQWITTKNLCQLVQRNVGRTLLILGIVIGQGFAADEASLQEARVQTALRAMYNRDYHTAGEQFRLVCDSRPFHPMGPLGLLAVEWYVNDEKEGYRKRNIQFLEDIEKALALYRLEMHRRPDRAEIAFFYGTVEGLRARILLGKKDYLGVLTSGYRAVRAIQAAQARCPDMPDFKLPAALFSYYVAISAPYMKIASWILQVSSSRETALKDIQTVADKGNYGRYEARSLLAYIYFYFEDNPTGTAIYARRLATELPDNPYYSALCAEALLSLRELDSARICLNHIEELFPRLSPSQKNEYTQRLRLLKGTLALTENDFRTAEKLLHRFITAYDYELDYELGEACLRLGNLYDLQNRRREAVNCYRRTIALNNRSAACRKAQAYLKKPYSVPKNK